MGSQIRPTLVIDKYSPLFAPLMIEESTPTTVPQPPKPTEDKASDTDYVELKESITTRLSEIAEKLNLKIDANTEKISQMINENKLLHRENASLKDQITKIESNQVRKNIIISRIPESKWEPYDTTVARIHDTIAAAFSSGDID